MLTGEARQRHNFVFRDAANRNRVQPNLAKASLLRGENAELRARLEELEQALQTPESSEETWAERQKEYEALLEEKSEVIRSLHMKIQELQEVAVPPSAPVPSSRRRSRSRFPSASSRATLGNRRKRYYPWLGRDFSKICRIHEYSFRSLCSQAPSQFAVALRANDSGNDVGAPEEWQAPGGGGQTF